MRVKKRKFQHERKIIIPGQKKVRIFCVDKMYTNVRGKQRIRQLSLSCRSWDLFYGIMNTLSNFLPSTVSPWKLCIFYEYLVSPKYKMIKILQNNALLYARKDWTWTFIRQILIVTFCWILLTISCIFMNASWFYLWTFRAKVVKACLFSHWWFF